MSEKEASELQRKTLKHTNVTCVAECLGEQGPWFALSFEPAEHIHWSNLAIARLRAGDARGAADAATRCIELNPRHAKG